MAKDKVGKKPLGWIGGGESASKGETKGKSVKRRDTFKPMTFNIRVENQERIRRMSYWDRVSIQDVVDRALNAYFEGKEYAPVPEEGEGEGG